MSTSDIAVQLAAARREYTDFFGYQVQGHNPAVGAAYEDVWANGGDYPFPNGLAANPLTAVSTDAADDSAGTGARSITITGIGPAGLTTETVTLDGVTPVPVVTAFQRIVDVVVLTAGSGQTNAGVITLVENGSGDVMSIIPIGYGRQQQVITSLEVPSLLTINASVGTAAGAIAAGNVVQFRLESRTFIPALVNQPVWIVRDEFQLTDSASQAQRSYSPAQIWGRDQADTVGYTDVRLRARCATASMLVQAVMGIWRADPDTTNGFRSYPFP